MIGVLPWLLVFAVSEPSPELQTTQDVPTNVQPEEPSRYDLRLQLSHLYGRDDVTTRELSTTGMRLTFRGDRVLELPKVHVQADGRFRKSWNDVQRDRYDVTRLYVSYGDDQDRWSVSLGRRMLAPVTLAHVDGVTAHYRPSEKLSLWFFGGLTPHPITRAVDPRFTLVGVGYSVAAPRRNHSGGLVVQMYEGQADRVYWDERFSLLLSPQWHLFGFSTVDFISQRGLAGDIAGTSPESQNGAEKIDLTRAHVEVRYRPIPKLSLTASGSHFHTILPNRWWTDWVASEQQRLGFTLEGNEPVGSRYTRAGFRATVSPLPWLAPYGRFRYSHRHIESAESYQGQAGIKFKPRSTYADISYTYRDHFETRGHLATASFGRDFSMLWGIEGRAQVLHTRLRGGNFDTFYDLNAGAWYALKGFTVYTQYQAFIESQQVQHVIFARLEYRLRTDEGR